MPIRTQLRILATASLVALALVASPALQSDAQAAGKTKGPAHEKNCHRWTNTITTFAILAEDARRAGNADLYLHNVELQSNAETDAEAEGCIVIVDDFRP